MVQRLSMSPKRLKKDSILESLLEIRFEHNTLPEVFLGRLADSEIWADFSHRQLPAANVPSIIREAEDTFRYQPTIELASKDGSRVVRVGASVISYHRIAPYPGWEKFKEELEQTIEMLFKKAGDVLIKRIGLRYINGLSKQNLEIESINDLDVSLMISDERLSASINLNFLREVSSDTRAVVRIASREFIQGPLPIDISLVADVDVFTADGYDMKDKEKVKQWVELAHGFEKQEFFSLLKENTIKKFQEE